jgi:hypothetical protein
MRAAMFCTRQIQVRKVTHDRKVSRHTIMAIIRTDQILVYGGVFSYCLTGMIGLKRSVA